MRYLIMFKTKIFTLLYLLLIVLLSSCNGNEGKVDNSDDLSESVESSQWEESSDNSAESDEFISDSLEESSETIVSLPFIPFD